MRSLQVQSVLTSLVTSVQKNEQSTLKYELFTSKKKGEFFVVETYADKGALKTHAESDYFKEGTKKIGPMLAGASDIKIVRKVGGFLRAKL